MTATQSNFVQTVKDQHGGLSRSVILTTKQSSDSFGGTCVFSMTVSSGNLACCGLGTISGFSLYMPHSDSRDLDRRLMREADIQGFLFELFGDYRSYNITPELIGVFGPTQLGAYDFFNSIFVMEDIHETTNKNYDPNRAAMRIVKINRDETRERWGIVPIKSSDRYKGLKMVPLTKPVQEYRDWLAKRYPNFKV